MYSITLLVTSNTKQIFSMIAVKIEIPPINGTWPTCNLRSLGLSTRPIFLANLRYTNKKTNELKNTLTTDKLVDIIDSMVY